MVRSRLAVVDESPAAAANGVTTGAADEVRPLRRRTQPTPLPSARRSGGTGHKQRYRGSNSDTQLSWGSSVGSWDDEASNSGGGGPALSTLGGGGGVDGAHGGAGHGGARPGSAVSKSRQGVVRQWEEWTVQEVVLWLSNIDVSKASVDALSENRIKGKHLQKLDDQLVRRRSLLCVEEIDLDARLTASRGLGSCNSWVSRRSVTGRRY